MPELKGRLEGKVAIITGAGQGIGEGIARVFAEEGAKVVVATRTEKNGAETVEQMLARRFVHSLTRVRDLNHGCLVLVANTNRDLITLVTGLNCVHQDILQHLVDRRRTAVDRRVGVLDEDQLNLFFV